MQSTIAKHWGFVAVVCAAMAFTAATAAAGDFETDLARITKALKTNPSNVPSQALNSCLSRRRFALQLYESGHEVRAARQLKSCFRMLSISETPPKKQVVATTEQDLQAKATRELEQALSLEPDVENGLEVYRECAACHSPEAWGYENGTVPQIAGQHKNVVIKQLADIRAGNRDNVLMAPYSSVASIGGAQAVADVAAYIDTLEIGREPGKGPGTDLELGERLYREMCAQCHGPTGEGNNELFVPRIHAQHFNYLVRQFEWIRAGKRRNANPEMVTQIQSFGERETQAVLDYVSRLEPSPEVQAPPGWKNPDFAQ